MARKNKADKISEQSQNRADLIADLLDKLEEMVGSSSMALTEAIIEEFVNQLTTENGIILTNEENLKKVAVIDRAWTKFNDMHGLNMMTEFITGIDKINNENLKYYRSLSDANIRPGDIKNIINSRLGLDEKGNPVKGGYMKGLMDDVSVRNEIKKFAYTKVTQGAGYKDALSGFRQLIQGNDEQLGAFGKFARNFVYDTYTAVDRLNATLYAEKLNLKYFLYQGTRSKGSRYFCIQRKGKVFSTEEAAEWVNLIGKTMTVDGKRGPKKILIGPIADKATYNPVIDMGGYGCVDVVSYVSETIAFQMRPELKKVQNKEAG